MSDKNKDMPPWLQPVDEVVDDYESKIVGGNLKKLIISIAVIVLGVFAVAMWFLYDGPVRELDQPLDIRAVAGPVRERPDAPGGMEVQHKDKEVFKRVTGEEDTSKPVLNAEAEVPISNLPSDTNDDAPIAKVSEPVKKVQQPVATQSKTSADTLSGTHVVQLGAYGSEKAAVEYWQESKAKYPSYFSGLSPIYQPVVTADGRTLYRLRVGPFKDRAAADRLCLNLKSQSQACIVAKK